MTNLLLLRHELTRLAQSPKTTLSRCILFASILGIAAATVPWGGTRPELSAAAARLFFVFFWSEMVLAAFVIPALVAPDIPVEREKGTLELLLACPQTERDVLLGKLGSNAAQAAALLGVGLPLAFAAVAYGGISLERVLIASVGIALTAILGILVAVRVSIARAGSLRAVLVATGWQAATIFGSALLGAFVEGAGGPIVASFSILACIAGLGLGTIALWKKSRVAGGALLVAVALAVVAAVFQVIPSFARSSVSEGLALRLFCPWATYVRVVTEMTALSFSDLALAWAVHLFAIGMLFRNLVSAPVAAGLSAQARSSQEEDARPVAPRTGTAPGKRVEPAEIAASHRALSRPGRGPGILFKPRLPIRGNPVAWRESLRASDDGNSRIAYFAAALSLAFLVPSFGGSSPRDIGDLLALWAKEPWRGIRWGGVHGGICVEIAIAALLVAANCAATLASEVDRGTLPLLLSTGYPVRRILAGKLGAAIFRAWPVLAVVAFHLALVTLDTGAPGIRIAGVAAMTIAAASGLAIGGAALGGDSRRALPLAIVLPLALWGLPQLLTGSWPELQSLLARSQPFSLVTGFLEERVRSDAVACFSIVSLAAAIVPAAFVLLGLERRLRT